jgi:hypothetical protein
MRVDAIGLRTAAAVAGSSRVWIAPHSLNAVEYCAGSTYAGAAPVGSAGSPPSVRYACTR